MSDALIARLEQAVSALPEDWQLAWQLSVEGMAQDEIATRVGKAPRTVRLWLARMRERIAAILDDF